MYDDLVKRLHRYVEIERSEHHGAELEAQAADAIEKLIEIIQNHDFLESLIKPRWIPVTERLPEKYGTYLVTTKRGSVMVGCYYPKAQNWNIRATAAYWMPLPEPPEEEV